MILRGFPKRSLFKRAKVFFFEAKGKNLKGHPERKSEESGKRERKKSVTYVPGIFRGVASPKPKRTGSLLSRRSSVSLRRKRRNSRQLTGSERRFLRVSLRQPLFISCRRLRQPRVSSPFPRPSSWLTHLSTLSHSLPSLNRPSLISSPPFFLSPPFFQRVIVIPRWFLDYANSMNTACVMKIQGKGREGEGSVGV